MTQAIQIGRLLPHPENCNFMEANFLEKVKRHIMRTGNYEPLTVRPHPEESGKYQVINGHHRLQVLKELGQQTVACTIWDLDDDQARLYLATLNRLAGKDVPERRVTLLEQLLETFKIEELSELLPDSPKELQELARLAERPAIPLLRDNSPELPIEIPVMLSFMLNEQGAAQVNTTLNHIMAEEKNLSRSGALLRMAESYFQQRQS